jgi:hypothetical protein
MVSQKLLTELNVSVKAYEKELRFGILLKACNITLDVWSWNIKRDVRGRRFKK